MQKCGFGYFYTGWISSIAVSSICAPLAMGKELDAEWKSYRAKLVWFSSSVGWVPCAGEFAIHVLKKKGKVGQGRVKVMQFTGIFGGPGSQLGQTILDRLASVTDFNQHSTFIGFKDCREVELIPLRQRLVWNGAGVCALHDCRLAKRLESAPFPCNF